MIRSSDFVLCNFPFRESEGPGPSAHIVLCAATGRSGELRFAIVFYTTSQIEFHGLRRPRQYLFVDELRAKELHQRRAFHVDASRIARLPLTLEYFPKLHDAVSVLARDPELVKNGRTTSGTHRRRVADSEDRSYREKQIIVPDNGAQRLTPRDATPAFPPAFAGVMRATPPRQSPSPAHRVPLGPCGLRRARCGCGLRKWA